METYKIDDCVIKIDYGRETTGMSVIRWNDETDDYDSILDSRYSGYSLYEMLMIAESEINGESEGAWADALGVEMPDDDD